MSEPTRGRVVMLVDNAVRNDSRVQKQARSAAELGWDVILIGKSPSQRVERFRLGAAKVRLIPVSNAMSRPRYQLRTGLLRGSMSYPSGRVADFRERQVEMKAYDARFRRMAHRQDAGRSRVVETWTKLVLGRALVEGRWVAARAQSTRELPARTSRLTGRVGETLTTGLTKGFGDRVWRIMHPHLWDFEVAYAQAIDQLKPDIIHANDYAMIGVGARALVRARDKGRKVALVYDAHEYVPGMNASVRHPWWLPALVGYEREFIGYADAVTTVSEPLAEMLQEAHHLSELPAVVLNAPTVGELAGGARPTPVRDLCELGPDVPLLVYSGSMTEARGVRIMVQALPHLQGAHVAFIVASPKQAFVRSLMEEASALGVRDRVHLLPYVDPEQVVEYVASADIGVHPTHHYLNHEISLATKFFEYAHAGLPIVVSDVRTMSQMVRETGQGEVFRAEDLDDYLRAVRAVLADPQRYRAAYAEVGQLEQWTWPEQARILDAVYDKVLRGVS